MINLLQLQASIGVDDREFNRKLNQAERTAQTKGRGIQSAFDRVRGINASFNIGGGGRGIGAMFDGMAAVAGGNLITGALAKVGGAMMSGVTTGVEYNRMLESSLVSFETLIGGADQARKHLMDLQAFGQKTPFELPGLIRSSQQMQAMGFKAREIIPMLTGVGNAMSAMGRNSEEEITRVTLALGQMASKGKVSAEEMMQLTEAGLPAWDLLAKAIGKTVAQTQKLAESGAIKGREAAIAISQQANLKYAGQMTRMSGTLQGLESNFNDILKQRLGEGSKGATEYLKKFYADAGAGMGTAAAEEFVKTFDTGVKGFLSSTDPILKKIADGTYFTAGTKTLNTLDKISNSAPVKAVANANVKNTLESLLTGEVDKIQDPVDRAVFKALSKAFSFVGSMGVEKGGELGTAFGEGAQAGAEQKLQIKSPSRVFIGIGLQTAEGYADGLLAGAEKYVAPAMDAMLMGGKKRQRVLPLPDRADVNLQKLIEKEPEFVEKLKQVAEKLHTKPEWLLQLMALESAGSFNPAIRGGAGNKYTGLIQFGPAARKDVGLPEDEAAAVEFLKNLGATGQLPYVQKYLQQHSGGKPYDSLAKLYAAVGAGHFVSDDDTVMFRKEGYQKGDDAANKKISGAGFRANAPWNVNKDSVIQQWEFGTAAAGALRLSDALESLGQTVTRINQVMAPQLSMIERQILHNPELAKSKAGGAYIATSPLAQSQTLEKIFGGNASMDISASLEKIPLALDTLGDAAKLNLKPLLELPPALAQVTEAQQEQLLTAKEILQQTNHMENLKEVYTGLFADLQNDLVSGQEKLSDVMRGFFRNFITSTLSELEQKIVEQMTGTKGGLAGLLGSAVSGLIGGFFGFGGVPKRAAGGTALANKLHIWNEPGAEGELFVPSQNGYILNRNDAMRAVSSAMSQQGSGGNTYILNNYFQVTSSNGQITKESQSQMAAKMAASLRQAEGRNS